MDRKYIDINGQKYFKAEDDEAVAPEATPEVAPEVPAEPTPEATPAPDAEKSLDELVNKATDKIIANLNTDKKEVATDRNILKFLEGKDLTDKNALTAEEKIVGFYHALVTGDTVVSKALAEGTNADGGFLVPDEFRAEIIKTLVGPFTMRGMVKVVPMRRVVMNIPSVASRPQVTWTAENFTKSTTTAHFAQIVLTARKVAAILYSSDELIADATDFDVVKVIIDLFADALKDEEDKVILSGNGTTQPTGLLAAVTAGTISARAVDGNLSFEDLIDVQYDLKQPYRNGAWWIVATDNVRKLRKIKDSDGNFIWQASVKEGQPSTLLGKPVLENDYVSEAVILYGNFKLGYWLGDRQAMTVKVSQDTETAFTKDQTAIRVVERIGGNVVLGEAIKALNSIP